MRNKNHNKRINHNNGLKIAIMLLGVMVGQGRVMCVTEGLGEGTATGSQGGAAIPALPFLRTFPADSMRNTGRGRGLRQELNTSRPQRASSLGVTPSSSSNELYPSVAPGSQVKPGQRWNRNAPLPRLQWGQPGGPAAADAPASPTPRSRSPEGSTPGVGSGALDSTAGDGTSDAGAGGAGDAEVRAASPTSRSPSPLRSPIVPAQVSLSRGPSLVSVASIELRDAQDDPAGDGAGFSQDPSSPIVPAQVSLSRSPRSEGSTPGVGSGALDSTAGDLHQEWAVVTYQQQTHQQAQPLVVGAQKDLDQEWEVMAQLLVVRDQKNVLISIWQVIQTKRMKSLRCLRGMKH